VALAAFLLAGAYAAYEGRKQLIQHFFARGPGGAPAPALARDPGLGAAQSSAGRGLARAALVRVALLDGVDRMTARRLPHYDSLCRRGLDLTVDVGFPTVSLPVQSVLWTGLTQQQSGIEFVQARVDPPPEGSLPAAEPSSAAVAESHPFISQSFGFARAWPPLDIAGQALVEWKGALFEPVAHGLAASETRLVFIHLLGPDTAGHRHGRDSSAFAAAAERADAMLGRLLAIDRAAHGENSRWLVLADHGHRAAGGHGGEEDDVRLVRACLAGAGLAYVAAPAGQLIHLVDLSRALADALGQAPHPAAAGRPLYDALTAPAEAGASLPRPGPLRLALAALVVAAALTVTWLWTRRSSKLPWWWVVAFLSVVAIESAPSLSTPMIYRPLGSAIGVAALPGLALLALLTYVAMRARDPVRAAVTQLLVPAGLCLGAAILCWREPPLMPMWTALFSTFLVLLFTGAAVVALACLASLVPLASDPGARSETPDSGS